MSHLSKIKTKFKNIDTMKEVLKNLGCGYQEGNLELNMPYRIDGNKHEKVDMIVNPKECHEKAFMGLKWDEKKESLELIGDDYGVSGFSIENFSSKLNTVYAEAEVKCQFNTTPELMEFELSGREEDDNGDIILTYQRW